MKLKLDLHTHCLEATNYAKPDIFLARKIINIVKAQGLDGIAITDHAELGSGFAYRIKEIIDNTLQKEIIIIPGQEIRQGLEHIVELFLPDNSIFRFLAHPGSALNPWLEQPNGLHGLEIDNGSYFVDKDRAEQLAQRYDLLLLSNSDAHSLSDIGQYYNEIDLEELQDRAVKAM
jgi:predicted metal-dependent phosphoesterase TrpH